MRRLILTCGAVCLMVATVRAQTITSYTLAVYLQGGGAPVTTAILPAASVTCGISPKFPAPTGTVLNPSRVLWDDEAAPTTADCRYTDGGGGPLLGLPFNPTAVYVARVAATNSVGTGVESASSNPFSRPGAPPAARTGVRVGG